MSSNNGTRLQTFDLLKLFAIYLVILGHVIQYWLGNHYTNMLWLSIYTFHVPLFLVISGYFFNYKKIASGVGEWAYLRKKVKTFIQPCLWAGFVVLLFFTAYRLAFHKPLGLWSMIDLYVIRDQWFLKSLLADIVLALMMFQIKNVWLRALSLVAVFVALIYLVDYSLWSAVDTFPYFLLGMLVRGLNDKMKILERKDYLIALLVIFFILSLGFKYEYLDVCTRVRFEANFIYIYIYRVLYAFCISCILISLMNLLLRKWNLSANKNVSTLAYYGQLTLYVYLIQYVVLERMLAFLKLPVIVSETFTTYVVVPIVAAIVLCICIAIYRITERNRLLYRAIWDWDRKE